MEISSVGPDWARKVEEVDGSKIENARLIGDRNLLMGVVFESQK